MESRQEIAAISLADLFKKEVERRIVEDAIAHVRPQIEAYAAQVVEQMKPKVASYMDLAQDRMVVQFIGEVPK